MMTVNWAPEDDDVPVLVLTGTVGAGKTSVGRAASNLLAERRVLHAFIDLDWMEMFWSPERDGDHSEAILHRNVAAVWANYRAAGCRRLIFCRVVESPAVLDRLVDAVPGARPVVVWLDSPPQVILQRLRAREPEDPTWFLDASTHVHSTVTPANITPHILDTRGQTPSQIAEQALHLAGWLTTSGE